MIFDGLQDIFRELETFEDVSDLIDNYFFSNAMVGTGAPVFGAEEVNVFSFLQIAGDRASAMGAFDEAPENKRLVGILERLFLPSKADLLTAVE